MSNRDKFYCEVSSMTPIVAGGEVIYEMTHGMSLKGQSIAYLRLKSGMTTHPHYHVPDNFEEVYTIVSGQGVMTLDNETFNVKAPSSVVIKSKVVHRLYNPYDEDVVVVVSCSPPWTPACEKDVDE